MYTVLLVDDEYLELQLLRDNIDWAAHGFRVCATAKNGIEALKLTQTLYPDVVITDIKMPAMDGIALSRQIHAQWPDMAILFLTGYDQRDYLKNALAVSAVDFLLKPIDLASVPDVLKNVKRYCDDRKTISAVARNNLREFVRSAATGSELSCSTNYVPALRCADGTKSRECYFTLLHFGEIRYLREKYGEQMIAALRSDLKKCCEPPNSACFQLNAEETLLLCTESFTPSMLKLLEPETKRWLNVITGSTAHPLQDARAQIAELRCVARSLLLHYGTGEFCILPRMADCLEATAQPDMLELTGYIMCADKSAVLDWLKLFYHCAGEDIRNYYILTSDLIAFLSRQLPPSGAAQELKTEKSTFLLSIFNIVSPVTMCDEFARFLFHLIDVQTEVSTAPSMLPLKRITAYIDTNLTATLSVESIATEFGLSANYFSTVFKREAGCTVLEYITERRLLRAQTLLETGNMKITQISSQLGYQNPSYFCALFSKKYGLTPAQYRRRRAE